MLKILPIIIAVTLCFSNLGFIDDLTGEKNSAQIVKTPLPRNHLTQEKNAQAASIETFSFEDATENPVQGVSEEIIPREQNILRLYWDIVPNAVKYEIFIEGGVFVSFTNGIEIPVSDLSAKFQINAIALDGNVLAYNIPVIESDFNPPAPLTTTEFEKMNYPPIYPVYSWIPTSGADHYEIELIKDDRIIRRYFTPAHPQDDNFDFYDKLPVLEEGEYFWRIRGLTRDNQPLTQWSTKNPANTFTVKNQIRFCAFGDSITHGGGSISVPPSTVLYKW